MPVTPLPVSDLKSDGGLRRDAAPARAFHNRGRQRMLAGDFQTRRQGQQLGFVEGRQRNDAIRAAACLRSSVPVLSTTSVLTFSSTSSAAASLTSTPAIAPLPVATMIAIGVAKPSAHGQAIIRTATAFTIA